MDRFQDLMLSSSSLSLFSFMFLSSFASSIDYCFALVLMFVYELKLDLWFWFVLEMADWFLFRPWHSLLMFEFRVFFHARQVFDEMVKRAFSRIVGHSTYAERWDWLSSVGRENRWYSDMRIVLIASLVNDCQSCSLIMLISWK